MKKRIHSLQGIQDGIYREARRMRREMTDSERLLWAQLRGNKIAGCHFRRQHVICGFITDFYCHKAKLIIKVDGGIHDSFIERDQIRDEILRSEGFIVLRYLNGRVEQDLERVVMEIKEVCQNRIRLLS
ncbi:MAG: endonuclease domain-containing protein [Anaerolineales bacterium]